MTSSSARSAAARQRAEQIALFRYQLIREAADDSVSPRQRGPMVRALAAAEHPGPFGGAVRVSRESLDRWIRAWRAGGFDALKPTGRTRASSTPEAVLSLAATLKREHPARTAAQVRRILIATLGDAPSESTLLRHFRTLDLPAGASARATGRFEATHPNEIWVGDGLHGLRLDRRKTYLFAFLDDHSRLVVAARWAFAEDAVRLSAALRPALEARGVPGAIYVDNGSAFVDASLARVCARLGIRLVHSRPYRPQGRGKIERFFNTVTTEFLTEVTTAGSEDRDRSAGDRAGSAVDSIDELNALFCSWVEMVYHRRTHTSTGQTPLQRWDDGWSYRSPDRRDPDVIAEAFRWSAIRKATKTATVSLHGNTYQVDPLLAGAKVELIYDPFDLAGPIQVIAAGGIPAGQAVVLEIGRHVHPKAANAAAEADVGAANAASGIDYLRLVQTRHHDAIGGTTGISFDTLTDHARTARETADGDRAGTREPTR
jgi:putative transposase